MREVQERMDKPVLSENSKMDTAMGSNEAASNGKPWQGGIEWGIDLTVLMNELNIHLTFKKNLGI